MGKKLKIILDDSECLECEEGISYKELAESVKDRYKFDIIGVKADNDYTDLCDVIKKSCNVKFYDLSSDYGNRVYIRSAKFILILAARNVLGKQAKLIFQYSQDGGIYCNVENQYINEGIINDIEVEMNKIVKKDYYFMKLS